MDIECCSSPDLFDQLQDDWNALLFRTRSKLIFLTHEWQQTWWEAYHPGELWVLTGRTEDGELAGIAPWFIQTNADGQRRVRTIGCVDVTDYLDIIAAEAHEDAFLTALADYVAASDAYDNLSLCNIPDGSATLTRFNELLTERGFEVTITEQDVCPVIELPATWDDYLANLDKKQRHEVRRKLRRASASTDWYVVGPEHDFDAEIDKFLRLMAASQPEKEAFLADEQNMAFFKAVMPRMRDCGWLQLAFLTANGEPAAAYLNFDYEGEIMVYNSGQDVEQFGSLSPGIVLLARLIRDAIERDRRLFNFLRGDENYKYQMGGQDTQIFLLKAAQSS